MITRVHIFVNGDVTGVGFRAWTYRNAIELGLTGWVKNVKRGKVEAVIEGEKDKIEEMITRCKKGPELAWVEKVEGEWENSTEKFIDFQILV